MSKRYISEEIRRLVASRADYLCEYCLIAEVDTYLGCQVDHIISLKHGGKNEDDNLAYACAVCNRNKGSDLGSIYWETRELIRFFDPRLDFWGDHFKLVGVEIQPLTKMGDVTARILDFNSSIQLLERQALIAFGKYPNPLAKIRMNL